MMSDEDVSKVLSKLFDTSYDCFECNLISRDFIPLKFLDRTNFWVNHGLIYIDLMFKKVAVFTIDRFSGDHFLLYNSITPVKLISKVTRHVLEGKKWVQIPHTSDHPIFKESFCDYDEIYKRRLAKRA